MVPLLLASSFIQCDLWIADEIAAAAAVVAATNIDR